ncbi:DUF5681 domain-containing protein [Erythrobacter sp. T5W1-R]|uniref:DUF5681 domain-containing protein n=1 Tax=Erythrobacter sp. T5W1-R TaxID=3101752 RepID=UPI002AFE91AD|nr:DUF5681 domain-containing protein [Erythrobacter sp. T5W1-R]MEA1619957.1 DUF5681 domain-containing protein [Erythrobacter sp. T5W1-R]
MSGTRFKPGQSGNPKGRPPKARRPNVSALEIVLDKRLTANVGGKERNLTVEEVLQQQTLKDALAGKRLAIRKVLKMIERREAALARKVGVRRVPMMVEQYHCADNANEAMRIMGIAAPDPEFPSRWKVSTWATPAALSRPGRRTFTDKDVKDIKFFTSDLGTLRWPRGRIA